MNKKHVHLIAEPSLANIAQGVLEGLGNVVVSCQKEIGLDFSLCHDDSVDEIVLIIGVNTLRQGIAPVASLANSFPVVILLNKDECHLSHMFFMSGVCPAYWEGSSELMELAIEHASHCFTEKYTLHKKIDTLSHKLEQRKWLDRTKGMLMDKHKMNEKDSYSFIQRAAMDNNVSMQTICENLLGQAPQDAI